MTLPLKKRRRMLEQTLIPQVQPYRVELSTMRLLKTAKELSDAFTESVQQNLEGLMIKDPNAGYKPADRKHWYKMKKDYLPENVREKAGLTMVDSVDLVVLGAAFGNGKNASLLSSYLMGCYDEEEREWQLVCKVCVCMAFAALCCTPFPSAFAALVTPSPFPPSHHQVSNGLTDKRLTELTRLCTSGDDSLMVRLDASASLPEWLPQSAGKAQMRPTHVLRKQPSASGDCLVFEVKGTEFTKGAKAAGSTGQQQASTRLHHSPLTRLIPLLPSSSSSYPYSLDPLPKDHSREGG